MADGRLNKCINCAKSDVNRHRKENLAEVQAYDRERGKLPHRLKANRDRQRAHPAAHKRALARYNKKYPERKAATVAVNNALRDGKLKKQLCEVCGDTQAEAHHDDYHKPLEVRWLCNPHHKLADKERRRQECEILFS